MKTKALLLTLMVLTMWSCSNDDNGTTEEQEEMTEYKIKKVVKTNLLSNQWSQELFFDEVGRMTVSREIIIDGSETYYVDIRFTFNGNNQIVERTRYVNDVFEGGSQSFVYDGSNRLIEIYYFDGTQTLLELTFDYDGNVMEVRNHLLSDSGVRWYTFDENNRIKRSETHDVWSGDTRVSDFIYSGNNLTEIQESTLDCPTCPTYTTAITYDNNPNPIFENFGNKFYYYTLGNPFTEGSRNHYSPNNLLSYTTDYSQSTLNYSNEIEYNEAGYPILMKEFKNGNQMNVITFEYYE